LSVTRLALFSATPWEFAAVRAAFPDGEARTVGGVRAFVGRVGKREYWLVRTGVGLERAARNAGKVLPALSWELAISTGFACALGSANVGDFIVGTEVAGGMTGSKASDVSMKDAGAARDRILAAISGVAARAYCGPVLSVERIVCRASEKEQLARSSGAVGLDMESAALAGEARKAGVPFVIVRTVSDLVNEDLPLDFNLFLRPARWLAGIGSVLAVPSRLAGLARLRRQSRVAAAHLTEFFHAYAASSDPVSGTASP
jgi:adenosylhomocysteine nucleosidase